SRMDATLPAMSISAMSDDRRARRGALAGIAVAALLLGAAARADAAGPVRLAVMEFGTAGARGADMEGMGAGLQSMITTDLAAVSASSLVLVERARLRDVVAELKLGRSALV